MDVGWNLSTLDAWTVIWEGLFWATVEPDFPRWKYEVESFVRDILERGSRHSLAHFYPHQQGARRHVPLARDDLRDPRHPGLSDQRDTGASCGSGPERHLAPHQRQAGHPPPTTPAIFYVQWQLNYPFNLMSECPVASVPSGFASNGVPTGIQLVGRTYDDVSVFRAAADYERARPWAQHRPPV